MKMKKILAVLMAVLMVALCFSACGGKNDDTNKDVKKTDMEYVKEKGKLVVGRKVIGPMRKACLDMMKIFDRDIEKIDPEFVFITHCSGEESVDILAKEVNKYEKI